MNKYTYLKIRAVIGALAALATLATLLLLIIRPDTVWAADIALAIVLVCDIHGVLFVAGDLSDHKMYPGREKYDGPWVIMALAPTMVGIFILAWICPIPSDDQISLAVLWGNFLLVILLGYGLGGRLKRKYSAHP